MALGYAAADLRISRWLAARSTRTILLIILAIGIVLPTVYLFIAALSSAPPTAPDRTFTWANIHTVYASSRYAKAMLDTVELALPVALLATTLALILGLLHAYATPYAPRFLRAVQMAPVFISPLISTVGWVTLASPDAGLLNKVLGPLGLPHANVFGLNGAILILTTIYTPYAFVFVSEAVSRIGADAYEAAQVAGASGRRILLRVTMPLLRPALLSAFIFTFVMACEIYSVPSILMAPNGKYVLANVIFDLTTGYPLDYQTAAAVGTVLVLVATFGFALHTWATRMQGKFTTQSGKSTRPVAMVIRTRPRMLSTIVVGLYVAVSVGLPLIGVIVRALVPYFSTNLSWSMFGWANFDVIRSNPATVTAIENSLLLGGAAVVLAIVVGGLIGYATIRHRGILSKAVAFLANLPIGIPGTVLAVGLVWTYLKTPVYGSMYILIIAVFFGSLPMVTRIVQNAVLASSPELEDAADTVGAPLVRRMANVVVPLIRSSLLMAAVLAFIFAVNEVSAATILSNGQTTPISVLIYQYLGDGKYGYAAALAVVQSLITAAVASILLLLATSGRHHRPLPHAQMPEPRQEPQLVGVGSGAEGTEPLERKG